VNDPNTTATMIAVTSTLAGIVITVLAQAWRDRVTRREANAVRDEARMEARRDKALAAVAELLKALDDHRRTMWNLGARMLNGADEKAVAEAESAKDDSRSAISIPLRMVEILVSSLAAAAHDATQATFAMRHPADQAALDKLREDAKTAHQRLVAAARDIFADMRVVA
jgi:hypothetical protein